MTLLLPALSDFQLCMNRSLNQSSITFPLFPRERCCGCPKPLWCLSKGAGPCAHPGPLRGDVVIKLQALAASYETNDLRDKQSCHIHSYTSPLVKIFQEHKCTLSFSCFCNTTWKWLTARSSSKSKRDPKDQFQARNRLNTKNSRGLEWDFTVLKSPIAVFLESKIWIAICTRHKILNTCSVLFFIFF